MKWKTSLPLLESQEDLQEKLPMGERNRDALAIRKKPDVNNLRFQSGILSRMLVWGVLGFLCSFGGLWGAYTGELRGLHIDLGLRLDTADFQGDSYALDVVHGLNVYVTAEGSSSLSASVSQQTRVIRNENMVVAVTPRHWEGTLERTSAGTFRGSLRNPVTNDSGLLTISQTIHGWNVTNLSLDYRWGVSNITLGHASGRTGWSWPVFPLSGTLTEEEPAASESTGVTIAPEGNGFATGALDRRNLQPGQSYSTVARPGPGMIFQEWRINGERVSTDPRLTFEMEEGMTLTPVFSHNPYIGIAGIFNGSIGAPIEEISGGAEFQRSRGLATLFLRPNGLAIGTLQLRGTIIRVVARFASYNPGTNRATAAFSVEHPSLGTVDVDLELDASGTGRITGTVQTDTGTEPLVALPSNFHPVNNPHPLGGGTFTILLPSPGANLGHGYGMLVMTPHGITRMFGRLADGTRYVNVTRAVRAPGPNSTVPIYTTPGRGTSLLSGDLTLNHDTRVVEGELGWLRTSAASAATPGFFPNGFYRELFPVGRGHFVPQGVSLLTGTQTSGPFQLRLRIVGDSLLQQLGGIWPANNVPELNDPDGTGTFFRYIPRTGMFQGRFLQEVDGRLVPVLFEGVVLPANAQLPGSTQHLRGGGFFLQPTGSGVAEIRE